MRWLFAALIRRLDAIEASQAEILKLQTLILSRIPWTGLSAEDRARLERSVKRLEKLASQR